MCIVYKYFWATAHSASSVQSSPEQRTDENTYRYK
jgi:hypothetical protein